MNVLIVNAHEKSPLGNKRFEEFFSHVKNFLKRCKERSGIDQIEYIVKDFKSIDDYLYYAEGHTFSLFSNPKNKRNFDKLDLIFFDGGEKYLPWKKNGYKFQILFKMCSISNKPIFAAGVGIQIMIYFLATNFLTEINVINSNDEIQSIEEINSIPKTFLDTLKKNDFFLDYVTGDLYEYRTSNSEWTPVMNVGLHKKKVAEKYMYRGKYILNPNFNRVKSANPSNHVLSVNTENKISIQKQFFSHWLLKDLPPDFVASINLTWFSHNFSLKSKDLQHKILCISANGPIIIEHLESVGVAFNISNKYPQTVKILENFIEKKFNETQGKIYSELDYLTQDKKLQSPILDIKAESFLRKMENMIMSKTNAYNEHKEYAVKLRLYSPEKSKMNSLESSRTRPTTSSMADSSRPFSNIKTVKHFGSHVGLGFSKRNMIFVQNNAVNERPISSINHHSSRLRIQSANIQNPFSFYMNNVKSYNTNDRSNLIDGKEIFEKASEGKSEKFENSEKNHKSGKLENQNGQKNLFGQESNLFYNGDIQSMKLIGPPSENNRIAKILNVDAHPESVRTGLRGVSSLDELKKNVDKEMSIKEGYLNFVPKEKMNDDQMIEYYKKMRRRITQNLFDITKNHDKKISKLANINSNKMMSNYHSNHISKISPRNRSPSINSKGSDKILVYKDNLNDKKERKDDINVFSLFFPYVKQEDFPVEKGHKVQHIFFNCF
jgi:hypothetical protein